MIIIPNKQSILKKNSSSSWSVFGAKEEFGWIQCIQTCEAYKYIQQTKWHSYSLCWWEIQEWFARGSDEKIPWGIQQKNKSSTIFCNEFNNTDFESTMTPKRNIFAVCSNHQKHNLLILMQYSLFPHPVTLCTLL